MITDIHSKNGLSLLRTSIYVEEFVDLPIYTN